MIQSNSNQRPKLATKQSSDPLYNDLTLHQSGYIVLSELHFRVHPFMVKSNDLVATYNNKYIYDVLVRPSLSFDHCNSICFLFILKETLFCLNSTMILVRQQLSPALRDTNDHNNWCNQS